MTNRIIALILTVVFMSLTVSCSTETADKTTAQKDNNSPETTFPLFSLYSMLYCAKMGLEIIQCMSMRVII